MISMPPTQFATIHLRLTELLSQAPVVDVGEWQARVGAPEGRTIELEDVSFGVPIPPTRDQLQDDMQPNLPWAEDHFLERVSGIPWNPPPSSYWWPFNVRGNEGHKTDEKFSHTYPERMWPKGASGWIKDVGSSMTGIRYEYGDLSDLVRLFQERPDTRQGYLPIWHPEDTGAVEGQRVPCTLGYHMMQRGGKLGIRYYLRSCDFVRHFRDDAYMAGRLCQWVCEAVGKDWTPGRLVLHISSLHAFAHERTDLALAYQHELSSRISDVYG